MNIYNFNSYIKEGFFSDLMDYIFSGDEKKHKKKKIESIKSYLIENGMSNDNIINIFEDILNHKNSNQTEEERKKWFKRYQDDIEPGKIIFFDRSWYNRGVVEPVMGYSTYDEYQDFMVNVNKFEEDLINSGTYLIKFWLSITKDTQSRRFDMRKQSPLKYWKFSPNDAKAQQKWDEYTSYKKRLFKVTSTDISPWVIIDSNDKRVSGLNAIRYVLSKIPYDNKNNDIIDIEYPEAITTIK